MSLGIMVFDGVSILSKNWILQKVIEGNSWTELHDREIVAKIKEEKFESVMVGDLEFIVFGTGEDHCKDELMTRKIKVYEDIFDKLDQGVVVSDHENRIIFINRACEVIEGIEANDCLNKKMEDVYEPTDKTPNRSMHSAVLNTGIAANEYWNQYLVKKTNKIMNVIERMYPVKEDGETIAVYSLIKNLPVLKRSIDESLELYTRFSQYKPKNGTKYCFENIVGRDISFIESLSNAKQVAKNNTTILIFGETGTGKELFAQSIHNSSSFHNGPFISINCAAIPSALLESMFFGTVKGAYTGASNSAGLFEQAEKGTLFLDEINSMDIKLQAKLLKVIENKKVRRLGSEKEINTNCRILVATNEPPYECVQKGILREDLYYRLLSCVLFIPPLRERNEDVELLANWFIKKFNDIYGMNVKSIDPQMLHSFRQYKWPGNVRELEHVIESAYSIAETGLEELSLDSISPYYRKFFQIPENEKMDVVEMPGLDLGLKECVGNYEKEVIRKVLLECGGNVTKAAENLKITRQSLQHKIKKYGL